jgi:RNA polymerase sigma factor (sigma-70 family)
MEASALTYSGGIGLHGRSPLLRLQSDERLIAYLRKGSTGAFEVLLSRYETRLLAFCRHLLGSREDAEDVLQEVMTAAFNAILADERPINVRPWLYRIARNRSLNHLRRTSAIGVDTMDTHFSDHGASTADKVHEREEFRLLVGDIHELPETQKTALVLREMDALSYEQIAEAMETTVSSVKSLLVRARVSLAEAAEARLLSCDEVRIELGEVAEGLKRRPTPLVRRHLRQCKRCSVFRSQLRQTNKALAALMPIGPFVVLKKLAIFHLGHSAASGSAAGTGAVGGAGAAGAGAAGVGAAGVGAAGAGAGAAGMGAAASGGALAGSGGFISAGLTAIATKAAAGLAAAALVTAGAVEADRSAPVHHPSETVAEAPVAAAAAAPAAPLATHVEPRSTTAAVPLSAHPVERSAKTADAALKPKTTAAATTSTATAPTPTASTKTPNSTKTVAGRDQTQTDPTVLQSTGSTSGTPTTTAPTSTAPAGSTDGSSTTGPSSTSTGSSPSGSGSGSAGSSSTGSGSTGPGSTGSSSSGSGTTTGPTGVGSGTVTSPTGTTISPTTPTGSTPSSTDPGPTTGPTPTLSVRASAARATFRTLQRRRRRLAWR